MPDQSSKYHNLVKLESEESGEFSKRKDTRPHLRLLITTHTWFIRDGSRLSQCPSYRNILYNSSCWYLYDCHFYSLASPKSARCISNVHILTCHVSLVHSRRLDCLTFRSFNSLLLHPCSSVHYLFTCLARLRRRWESLGSQGSLNDCINLSDCGISVSLHTLQSSCPLPPRGSLRRHQRLFQAPVRKPGVSKLQSFLCADSSFWLWRCTGTTRLQGECRKMAQWSKTSVGRRQNRSRGKSLGMQHQIINGCATERSLPPKTFTVYVALPFGRPFDPLVCASIGSLFLWVQSLAATWR